MSISRLSRNRIALSLLTLGAAISFAPGVKAQVLYDNLVSPQVDSRNGSVPWLGTGSGFVQESNFNGSNGLPTLVSQMMMDDIYLFRAPNAASATITSITVAVANGNVGIDQTVRVYLRIYDNNSVNPLPSEANGPGTLLKALDLGVITLAGATADTDSNPGTRAIVSNNNNGIDTDDSLRFLTVSSSSLDNLTLPFNPLDNQSFYWFGLFFEQDRNLALTDTEQKIQLGQVGQAFYNGAVVGGNNLSPTGASADVIYETAAVAASQPLQRNRFSQDFSNNPGDQNVVRDRFQDIFQGQTGNANFGWQINGSLNLVPEPGAGALLLLGVPALMKIARRRRRK